MAQQSRFRRGSAGVHLTHRVPTATAEETVAHLRRRLKQEADEFSTMNYIYVLDDDQRLDGVLSIKKIFTADDDTKLSRLATQTLITCHPDADREQVANLALKHNIKAVPVVDSQRTFLGVVPSDEILNIAYEEIHEDMLKSAGILSHRDGAERDSVLDLTIFSSFRRRFPWVAVGLVGGLLAARIIHGFSQTLEEDIILAAFIPLIVYIGNAVGAQTQTLFVRDLATEDKLPFLRYAWRQLSVSAWLAVASGLLIYFVVHLFFASLSLGIVIALSAVTAILAATMVGLIVPYVLLRFRQDPADGGGPFATIVQDIASIVIYFSVATLLLEKV